jgi:hypothetical protein
MLNLIKTLEDYIKINGERSSGRLVFVIGSLIVFGVYIYDHKDNGVQNIMIAILGYSSASITLSKFIKTNKQTNDEIK